MINLKLIVPVAAYISAIPNKRKEVATDAITRNLAPASMH
jgi:hypothetical protein